MRCRCCGGVMPPGPVPREDIVGLLETRSDTFRAIVRRLAWRPGQMVTSKELADHIWRDDPDGGPETADRMISVVIWKYRDELEPLGWRIQGRRAKGNAGGYWLEIQPQYRQDEPPPADQAGVAAQFPRSSGS